MKKLTFAIVLIGASITFAKAQTTETVKKEQAEMQTTTAAEMKADNTVAEPAVVDTAKEKMRMEEKMKMEEKKKMEEQMKADEKMKAGDMKTKKQAPAEMQKKDKNVKKMEANKVLVE